MELTYRKNGDYLIPNLVMDEQPQGTLRKYGMMRKTYLKENKSRRYTALLLSNKLQAHLLEVQKAAEERVETIIAQMAEEESVNEQLKASNQMKWVQMMNNINHSAEEIVLRELIYN